MNFFPALALVFAVPALAADWPRILGPADNATSPETGLLHELPKDGPRIVWQAAKGNGFGGPAIVGDRLVIFNRVEKKEVVECLDAATGQRVWSFDYEAPYHPRYGGSEGPRTSPVIADGRVFTFGISGRLHCVDLASGAIVWQRDLAREYKMRSSFFGYGSTPLVLGSRLIVQLGGEAAGQRVNSVALDVATGKPLWAAAHPWGASYASSVPALLHGRECVLVFAGGESDPATGGLLVIDAANGKVLGSGAHRSDMVESVSAASPVVLSAEPGKAARVLVSCAYGPGAAAFDIAPDFTVKRAWSAVKFETYWMTPFVRDQAVIGFSGQSERLAELVAQDVATGKELWRSDLGGGFGRGSLLAVDGGILCLGEFGDLAWLDLSRTGAAVKSRAKLFNAPETWTPPAISGGRLFICQNEQGRDGTNRGLFATISASRESTFQVSAADGRGCSRIRFLHPRFIRVHLRLLRRDKPNEDRSGVKIVLLTPGTGSYHCGVCMRDNALARELIRQGHDAMMLPMYLPLTLDEDAASPEMPIFFGGVSTYLREKFPLLRHMPRWLDRLLSHRVVLKLVAGKAAAKTGGPDVAEMTLSMLRGMQGNQAGEIDELVAWLREHARPEALWLSTALQAGLARRLQAELRVPVIGFLQGEDSFIDGLGAPWSAQVWALLAERMRDADVWIAPSRYFAELMASRLGWSEGEAALRIRVVPNGVALDGYAVQPPARPTVPTIGYLARFVPGKGIGILVEAFIELKKRGRFPDARLRCAGSMADGDAKYVGTLPDALGASGRGEDVEWLPNVSREEKIAFLESLTVFSVPASYSEAFGLYVIEALAARVPVVLPNASAFPEIVEGTGGGVLYEPTRGETANGQLLATALESLLADREAASTLGLRGRFAVEREYSLTRLASRLVEATRDLIDAPVGVR